MELSVVIITLNEEHRLGRTLEAVAPIADEIVIVDSGSTDRTRDVASAFPNVVWLERQFDRYGKQKNFGNDHASGRYILSLDADEVLSSALRSEIAAEKGQVARRCLRIAATAHVHRQGNSLHRLVPRRQVALVPPWRCSVERRPGP